MKYLKKATSALLALCMIFALCVSASANESLFGSNSKSASVGTTATITGEIWSYNHVYNGTPYFEPRAKTIVNSSKTMAQVTVKLECRYNDTGALVSGDAIGSDSVNNSNNVDVKLVFGVFRRAPVVAFSSHGATYSKSDVLYMTTNL